MSISVIVLAGAGILTLGFGMGYIAERQNANGAVAKVY
jgi:hypothetical protein